MIKLRPLILEIENNHNIITPRVIFNFYYLWFLILNNPEILQTQFGKEISTYYSALFKQIYVRVFSHLIHDQLRKYVLRKRIDSDFPIVKLNGDLSSSELLSMMKKTWRSDLKRRNDVWIMLAEFNNNLSKSNSVKDIFLWVDRCNSAIHNTGTSILGKISHELMTTYDTIHTHDPKYWKQYVDKDIRQLDSQGEGDITESGHSVKISKSDRENTLFMMGLKQGVIDKANDVKSNLDRVPEDYIRGYELVKRASWWDKTNAKLTQWASELGNSYGKRY